MKETAKHIDVLDYFRGLAILAVFLFHCLATVFGAKFPWDGLFRDFSIAKQFLILLPIPACIGNAGVPIFFVVSGFCIHMSFQKYPQWGSFFARRFFRIYPPYFLAVLLLVLFLPDTIKKGFGDGGSSFQLISHLLLIHNFNSSTHFGINPSFWSIAVEVQLYLLYPVLLKLVGKFDWRKTLFALLACQVLITGVTSIASTMIIFPSLRPIALQIGHYNYWLAASPLAYWFSWSLGAYIADAYLRAQPFLLAKASLVTWFGLSFLIYFIKPLEPFTFLFFSMVSAIAISKLLNGDKPRIRIPKLCMKHLRLTGLWSYSIYLFHQPLLVMFNAGLIAFYPEMMHYPFVRFWLCVVSWFAIMFLGGLAYRFWECPCIAAGKKFIQRFNLAMIPAGSNVNLPEAINLKQAEKRRTLFTQKPDNLS